MTDAAPTPTAAWSLTDDCNRLRDLFRRHGFMVRARDARDVWERKSRQSRSTWLPLPEADDELFAQSIRFLHEWMAEEVEPEDVRDDLTPHPGLGRPTLVDESDGPCEICARWAAVAGQRDADGKVVVYCQECGARIVGMEHNGNRGVESCVPHHYHLHLVNGSVPGRKGVTAELCMDCAIALRLKAYPPDVKDKHGNYNPTADQMRAYRG